MRLFVAIILGLAVFHLTGAAFYLIGFTGLAWVFTYIVALCAAFYVSMKWYYAKKRPEVV